MLIRSRRTNSYLVSALDSSSDAEHILQDLVFYHFCAMYVGDSAAGALAQYFIGQHGEQ